MLAHTQMPISTPNELTYNGPYLDGQIYEPGIEPILPEAFTMAIAAAFFALGRVMVFETQASMTKVDA